MQYLHHIRRPVSQTCHVAGEEARKVALFGVSVIGRSVAPWVERLLVQRPVSEPGSFDAG